MAVIKPPKLTLVAARTANSAVIAGGEDEDDEAKFLADLRGLLWAKGGSSTGGWKELAATAKLSDRTIQRFASGETKRPQLFTIRRMFTALDYVMLIQPRKRGRK